MRYEIWAAVQNPGGTKGILPVVDELEKDGHSVLLVANGKAVEMLRGGSREHIVAQSAAELLKQYELPRVVITSMCTKGGGVGRELATLLQGKVSTVAFQDIHGGTLTGSWKALESRPNFIVTNDEVGKDIIAEYWPDFPVEHIWVTGFPALDKYASMDVEAEAGHVRRVLGLDDLPFVLFVGQGPGDDEIFAELDAVASDVEASFYFHPRPHPRTREDFPEIMIPWQKALARFRGPGRLIYDLFGACTGPQLLAACALNGVVISTYSTMLTETAALRGNAIAVLYAGTANSSETNVEIAGFEKFPLVELGCVAGAHSRGELKDLLRKAFDGTLNLRSTQEKYIRVDGRNAHRAADKIIELL